MNQKAAQAIIREASANFLNPGIQGALDLIKKNLDRPTIVPVKFAQDYFVTQVIRDGQPVKIQVEVDEYQPASREVTELNPYDPASSESNGLEVDEHEGEVCWGRAYTADWAMIDIQPTEEEYARFTTEFLEQKRRDN